MIGFLRILDETKEVVVQFNRSLIWRNQSPSKLKQNLIGEKCAFPIFEESHEKHNKKKGSPLNLAYISTHFNQVSKKIPMKWISNSSQSSKISQWTNQNYLAPKKEEILLWTKEYEAKSWNEKFYNFTPFHSKRQNL